LQRGAVVGVFAAEVVQHLHAGALGGRVPGVVGQLQVAHHLAAAVAPWGRPEVHGLDDSTTSQADQLVLARRVSMPDRDSHQAAGRLPAASVPAIAQDPDQLRNPGLTS
jgi:hypothetical protein